MSKPSIPIGTTVRFLIDSLGASEREELYATTGETYGIGERGVVSFVHPNRKMCADWVYVEVESKSVPGEKRYVGVTPRMVCQWPVSLPKGCWRLLREIDEDDNDMETVGAKPLKADEAKVAEVLAQRGLCKLLPGCKATYSLTDMGREALAMSEGA